MLSFETITTDPAVAPLGASLPFAENWTTMPFQDGNPKTDNTPSCLPDRDALFAEFAPLVNKLAYQYGKSSEARRELHAEMYYQFCRLLNAFDPTRAVPLRAYLFRQLPACAYSYARQNWRREDREVYLDSPSIMQELNIASTDPTHDWNQRILKNQIETVLPQALGQIPQRQRQVVVWRYYDNLSYDEIATLLDIRVASARSLLRHGLTNLFQWMQQHSMT